MFASLAAIVLLVTGCGGATADTVTLSREVLLDKIKGGWAGQTFGCTYGGPTEFKYNGTIIPDEYEIPWPDNYIKWWYDNEPGLYDDVYMDLTFVEVYDKYGLDVPVDSMASAFAYASYKLWHANQAARYNILNGMKAPESGHWKNNPHADDLDFQIEADFAGLMSPGMPNSAAEVCDGIGHIMTYGNGWYGGANETRSIDPNTYYKYEQAVDTIKKYNPYVMIFGGTETTIRWIGNEEGWAGDTQWSMFPKKDGIHYRQRQWGLEDGEEWLGGECDVSIRPGWFYHPEEDGRVKTVDELTDLYYRSVGHNATLLLNFPVDRDGLIHPTDSANAVNFHKNIQKQLEKNLLAGLSPKASDERGKAFSAKAVTDNDYDTYWATNDDVTSATIEFDLPQPEKINRMMLQEYIPLGQRVKSFVVEYNQEGEWLPVKLNEETTTVGYKRLLRFETITTDKLRVRFTDSRACLCINNIEAFYAGATSDTYSAKAEELKSFPFTLSGVDTEEAQKCMDKNDQTACFVNGNTLLIDLGEERTITSFHYLPDQSEYNKGVIAAYEISVGMDSNAVNQVVAKDEFSNIKNNPILQSVYFTPLKARYVQLKATRMIHDGEPLGLAEIGIQ